VTSKVVPVLVVLLAAGCRSDGGVDRVDCKQGMDFALHSLVAQTQVDLATTSALISSIPGAIAHAPAESMRTMSNTYHLYFETHEPR
jgi:hypothetical protein